MGQFPAVIAVGRNRRAARIEWVSHGSALADCAVDLVMRDDLAPGLHRVLGTVGDRAEDLARTIHSLDCATPSKQTRNHDTDADFELHL